MSSSDRFPYLTETTLDQSVLDACHDNLTCQLELAVDIETPTGTIYASNRNKYVGSTFYEALLNLPVIERTLGDWLSPELEFSALTLNELSNVDGRFNEFLPGGANFGGWIGKEVEVKLGLRDVAATYKTIFKGEVTPIGGVSRTINSIGFEVRDQYDKANKTFPTATFTTTDFPDIEDEFAGMIIPVIYGDWTTNVNAQAASVPAFPVNGADSDVIGGARNNLELVISDNDNVSFDTTEVWLRRGADYWQAPSGDITGVVANRKFEIVQNVSGTWVDGGPFEYSKGDEFYVKVKGKDVGAYDDNFVWIARDVLISYGGVSSGDIDSTWATYRDKSTPAQSNIAGFKCRVWLQEPQGALSYSLQLLEQVRLEAYVNRDLEWSINSLHFEDWTAQSSISYTVKNWDVVKDSFRPSIDTRINFNRAQAFYNWLPEKRENTRLTSVYKNAAAITQAGNEISKKIELPNVYEKQTAIYQTEEVLKLASAFFEIIDVELTWRALLLDLGDFVKLDVSIQSIELDNTPAMVRRIGYDPAGLKIPVRLWSLQMVPYTGWSPTYSGITGGATATITEET